MARSSYRNFLRLLEKWPLDETKKGGRDLGEHLRIRVSQAFKLGEATPTNESECQRIHASLNRIANNTYVKKYPRTLTSTATGLSVDECRQIASTEFLDSVKEKEEGMISSLFKKK